MKALTGLVIGAFAVTAISATTPALADGHGNKLMKQIEMKVKNKKHAAVIAKRRQAMRALGGNMKRIAGYLKANKGGPKDVAQAAGRIAQIAKATPALFPAGTGLARYPGVTGAKPIIFKDKKAGFTKEANKLAALAMNLQKVASAPGAGKGQIGKAFGAMGKMGCGGCHKTYRKKLKK